MFAQNGKLITITAIAVVLLAIYGVFIYLFVFPEGEQKTSSEDAPPPVATANLNPSKIRLDVKNGYVSSDKKMTLDLKLSGLENKENIEEIRKDGNLLIEIDGQKAEILETSAAGEDEMEIRATAEIGDEKYKDFTTGKPQNIDVRADINYGKGDTAAKMLSTNFKKSGKSSSMGEEMSFGDKKETVAQTEPNPVQKPQPAATPKPTPQKKPDEKVKRRKQKTTDYDEDYEDDYVYPVNRSYSNKEKVGKAIN